MKEKVIIDKESCERLMGMLNSSDRDNRYIALKAINESNIKESMGYIMLLYKFSKAGVHSWNEEAPEAMKMFADMGLINDKVRVPTASALLETMIRINTPIETVKKYLEFHSEQLIETLSQWGYPMKYMNVEITLKEKEYEQDGLVSKS
jgi:hypothetical protein